MYKDPIQWKCTATNDWSVYLDMAKLASMFARWADTLGWSPFAFSDTNILKLICKSVELSLVNSAIHIYQSLYAKLHNDAWYWYLHCCLWVTYTWFSFLGWLHNDYLWDNSFEREPYFIIRSSCVRHIITHTPMWLRILHFISCVY